MKRVGITGGIGCGKSTVVAEFAKLGVPTFVADNAGAALYEDSNFLHAVAEALGPTVLRPDGTADKQAIAAIVFADEEAMHRLNTLVHPRVMQAFETFCTAHSEAPYVLFESAILYDYGIDRQMDSVVCVYLDKAERMRRLRLRDHATDAQLEARINKQMTAEEMMRRADYVILNYEGNPRQRQVATIDKILRQ